MTTTVLPLWLEVIKAVAPLLAALLAAGVGAWVAHKFGRIQEGIARQQAATASAAAATAQNKLKLELFDRRLAVYEAAKTAIDSVSLFNYPWDELKTAYTNGIDPAPWLFDSDVLDYLNDDLWPALAAYARSWEDVLISTDPTAIGRELDARSEMFEHRHRVTEVFAPYLKLAA